MNFLFMKFAYFTGLPILGFFIRLTKLESLNSILTLLYAIVYWVPFSTLRSALVLTRYRDRKLIWRRKQLPFLKPGCYTYDGQCDLYRSKYNLDDDLEAWGWAEYIPIVYNSISCKYNNNNNFKVGYFSLLQQIFEGCADDDFAILDIGQGTGNSTKDIRRVVDNAYICCLDISESLIKKAQKVVPDAYFFKGSMMDTGFLDASFDVIINYGGINETDVKVSISETWRIAKANSLIIIADENFDASSYLQKLYIVFLLNLSYVDSYKYDGSATREDKRSIQIIDQFLQSKQEQCTIVRRATIAGFGYSYVIHKHA